MPKLHMMVGIPYSGKSTYVKKLTDSYSTAYVYSTDAIIEEIAKVYGLTYGDIFQKAYPLAEMIANKGLAVAIKTHRDVIWDQTNLTAATRKGKMSQFPAEYVKIAYIAKTNMEQVIERSKTRPEKVIPMHIISDMQKKLENPDLSEGFAEVVDVS